MSDASTLAVLNRIATSLDRLVYLFEDEGSEDPDPYDESDHRARLFETEEDAYLLTRHERGCWHISPTFIHWGDGICDCSLKQWGLYGEVRFVD